MKLFLQEEKYKYSCMLSCGTQQASLLPKRVAKVKSQQSSKIQMVLWDKINCCSYSKLYITYTQENQEQVMSHYRLQF